VKKCLQSAIANAENNHGLDVDDLVVAEAWVGKNLVMKRGRPRARGRFGKIMKPFSETHHQGASGRGASVMGQKVNPIGMRLQVNRTWDSRWFADGKEYGNLLLEDLKMRDFIREECKQAGVSRVIIERPHKKCRVTIHTARPGVIIGKKGADIEGLRKKLANFTDSELHLNIVEVRKPELDAQLVAESIAQQLERRVTFRRAMKRSVQNAMRMGALGIRVNVGRPPGGAEIARTEWYREGRVPLHTLRADIDYALAEAKTALRHHRGQGLDLQGRDHGARPAGPRPPRRRGSRRPPPAARRVADGAEGETRCCNRNGRSSANSTRAASTARPRAGST
jgi:small subunit ribosomal protein S3